MVISYDNLWKLLIDKKMNKTDLKDQAGITYNIIARLGKGESVSMESLYKWNGNSFFDKFYKVQNFFPYAIPIVLDNEPPRM
ncbi:MAG: helix-turn-helix transcriptional regulator [Enterococcus gallinarum]|uniref:helix-turn-helix domain-containing protein n=2 Tax=Enterococcus gallinarum TaxID=1353 RepID=UPI002A87F797|nr:helix-turn-helix transcriptional regulator [Enterococcus gallinarum]MDY4071057.1 helix-turn-helix transcriptional regulator [Enterococcus gallinarum]